MKKNITLGILTIVALFLNACGGGSSTETATIEGKLIDSPVYGAQYKCGQIDNVTKADGSFICETLPVTFYVGGVKLGEVHKLAEDGYVTPQDLLGVTRQTYGDKVNDVALFLQSLDDDGNIETAITLKQQYIEKLKTKQYDIHTMTHDQIIDLLEEIQVESIVSREEAYEHLRTHVEAIPTTHIEPDPVKDNPTEHNPVEDNPTEHNPVEDNPVIDNPIESDPSEYNPIKS